MTENEIGTLVVESAVRIHRDVGPGLYENVYEVLLAHLLGKEGLDVQRQIKIPVEFDGIRFDEGFRADLVVDGKVIVELKSAEAVTKAHKKQLLTYLRLTGMKLGYLLNFGEALMKDGVSRIINGHLD